MLDKLRVFISSTIEDLEEERKAVEQAVREMRYEPVRLEDLGSMSTSALEASLLYDDRCDIYVGVIGKRYGYVPKGESRSVTELEYLRAREIGLPVLIYIKQLPAGEEREEKEKEFLKRVEGEILHAKPFSTVEELAKHVQVDIDREVTKIVQERHLVEHHAAVVNNVLIASLGRAPGAVTGLYAAIESRLGIKMDEVVTLSAEGHLLIRRAVSLLEDEFGRLNVKYNPQEFKGIDVRDESEVLAFKIKLTEVLRLYQHEGAEIYLGIAGGRTSMGALIAMVAAIESPNAVLYHMWVPDEIEKDGDIENLWALSDHRRGEVLFPTTYTLVKVPFVRARQK